MSRKNRRDKRQKRQFSKQRESKDMNPTEKERMEEELRNEQTEAQQEQAAAEEQAQAEAQANEEQAAPEEAASTEKDSEQLLADAEAKIAEQQDKYLRLSAEFDNYRKRTLKEKSELIKSAGEKVIVSILPVIDDMERALQNMKKSEEAEALSQGVELIYQKFLKVLQQEGLKVIETAEQPFDTDYHEAIAMVPAPTEEAKGKVLDCVQTGYTLNEKVIRHAKVVVAQ
jgi:molecular chaperone GrpE